MLRDNRRFMPPLPRFFLLSLALGAPLAPALAQDKPAAPSTTLPAPASLITSGPRGEQFILGPDDVISLQVANHPEMSAESLTLSSTGRVALPVLGPLTIKGKTLEQARIAIAAAYKSQLRDPKVSITLVRARPRQATVLGAVGKPGAVDLQPGWRVSEVLAAAGSLNGVTPDEVNATLKRLNAAPIALDLQTIYRAPENKANPRVLVGDVISVVPIPQINVTINGDVGTPGPQSSRRAPKLLDALGRAGDLKFSPDNTDITLLRGGNIEALDVAAASANPSGAANIELRDGDLLSVQGVRLNVNVAGDNLIKTPGYYPLEGRSAFIRAISAAGGLVVAPSKVSAVVRRGNEVIPVDVERAYYDPAADVALKNNDLILLRPIEGPRVRLAGEVKNPDQYSFKEGTKVLEAVLQSGGLNIPSETAQIAVLRTLPDGRQISLQVDAGRLWRGNDLSQNVKLSDGDVILVNPIGVRAVSVVGEVEKEDAYELKPGDGLTEVLLRAGGPTPLAALSRITIYRKDGAVQTVNYANLGAGEVPAIKLEDGDRVQVPKNPNQVLVSNAVANPGPYGIPEGQTLTLVEALNLAGNPLPGARTNDITVLRRAPVSAQAPEGYIAKRVKLDDALKGKLDQSLNYVLMPGDVVVVPQGGKGPSGLQNAISALGAFNVLRGF